MIVDEGVHSPVAGSYAGAQAGGHRELAAGMMQWGHLPSGRASHS